MKEIGYERSDEKIEEGQVSPGNVDIVTTDEGGEATIAAMNEYQYTEIGRKTYNFVRRCMRNPELRERIRARAAEIRAARGA